MRFRLTTMAVALVALALGQGVAVPAVRADDDECPAPLALRIDRPRLITDLGGGTTLRVWKARDPRREGTFPISVITLRGSSAHLAPEMGATPGLLNPRRPFTSSNVIGSMNGDFFSYMSQTKAIPRGLVVSGSEVMFAPNTWSRVLAIDSSGRADHAVARVAGTVRIAGDTWKVDTVNDPRTRSGHNLLTQRWDGARSMLKPGHVYVHFAEGRVTNISNDPSPRIKRGSGAISMLARDARELRIGQPAEVSVSAVSRGGRTVTNASGHGGLILHHGQVRDLCSAYESLARPRSMIAWDHSGRTWMLTAGTGEAPEGSIVRSGGATKTQLAQVAQALGATGGVILDGGGSTAMYARWSDRVRRLDAGPEAWVRPVPVVWTVRLPPPSA